LETTWFVVVPPGWKRKRGRRKFKGKGALIKRLGKNNKDMGYWAGSPDLFLAHDGKTLFIELKSKTGRLQPNQKATIKRLMTNNMVVVVARSVDEAKRYTIALFDKFVNSPYFNSHWFGNPNFLIGYFLFEHILNAM
jgi:hypothetical protein